ncbi:MAG: DUF5995 family protein [Byssovorax sp.]
MSLLPGFVRPDRLFHPSIGAAAEAVVSHSAAAARSAGAFHAVVHHSEDLAGHALLVATAAGGSALASAVVQLAALEALVVRERPRVITSSDGLEAADAAVLAALKGRSIQSIPDVIAVMARIDAALPDGDGLKWFNRLYRLVTEGVGAHVAGAWEGPAWLNRLDLVFAELYFSGIERCLATPGSAKERGYLAWRALLDVRRDHRIAPVQFALAGMSAHINRDLAVAVTRTWAAQETTLRTRDTPEFRDYRAVDQLLDKVEPKALDLLCSSVVLAMDEMTGRDADWTALQILHGARALAWSHAEALNCLGAGSPEALEYIEGLDTMAAGCAKAALVPVG